METANKKLKMQMAKVYNPFTEMPITMKEVGVYIPVIRENNYRYGQTHLKMERIKVKRLICNVTGNRNVTDNTRKPNLFPKSNQYKMVLGYEAK